MKSIQTTALKVGTVPEADYVTENRQLLISKGVVITPHHIEALKRRHISRVYINATDEHQNLRDLLSYEFDHLDELHLDDCLKQQTSGTPAPLSTFGKAGLAQLLAGSHAREIDSRLQDHQFTDRPIGLPLKSRLIKRATCAGRAPAYKEQVLALHNSSLQSARQILQNIARGETVSALAIRRIVEGLVKLFVTDKEVCLALTALKHEGNDAQIYYHSLNVCILSIAMACSGGFSEEQVVQIGMGALLHDVGMLLMPDHLLHKEGRFTEDEWFEIQKHPILGINLIERIKQLPDSVAFITYQSHERDNGRGYPKQRTARFIHRFARIVHLADSFEALSAPRAYREAYVPFRALELIIKMTQEGLLGGDMVKAMLEYQSLFVIGSIVMLSNNCLGRIIGANGTHYAKPTLSVLTDTNNNMLHESAVYQQDLSLQSDLHIVRVYGADYLRSLPLLYGF